MDPNSEQKKETQKKKTNPQQEKLHLDINAALVRTAAEALDESVRSARQAHGRGVLRMLFVP